VGVTVAVAVTVGVRVARNGMDIGRLQAMPPMMSMNKKRKSRAAVFRTGAS
jgi:hypothetical protein